MSGVQTHDASDLRKYRTEIPNIVLEMGLSPYALALYVHLKRTAGQEGACWKSTRTLARETGISAAKVCDARKELEERSLIVVDRPEVNGSRQTVYVTIADMWPENFQHFSERSTERSPHERSVHTTNAERSPHEHRKEPLRKEPKRNAPQGADGPHENLPAKALTTLTIDRVKEVGFDPASHQKQNWGKGWATYVYVAEGETPPTPEEQFAVLGEIVAAAAGKGGKPRYFLAVEDALKRVGGNVTPLRRPGERPTDPGSNSEEAAARRTEGYEFFFA